LRSRRAECHDAGAVPTYDYQCRSCGAITEVIHAMSEDGPTVCELCGGDLRRVLYPAGIIFKGSGFYRTDSRASGGSGSSESSTSSGSSGAKPASGPSGSDGTSSSGTSSSTESSGSSTPSGSGSESAA
jgi:putative FmdB family regulatory protein